jgi:hypothetical protein
MSGVTISIVDETLFVEEFTSPASAASSPPPSPES